MKKFLVLAFSLVTLILVGCGQVAQQTGSEVSEVPQVQENVVASAKLTISMTGNESDGYSPSAIETIRIATQSVEIEANVPSFMTFDVNSTIAFDVNQLAWIEANGFIQINVSYNQLLEESLQNVRVRAYMVEADGLVGQINANNIIPLEVEVTAPPMLDPFSPLTTEIKNLKQWDKPFNQAINEIITLRLKGDFTGALNQQFKGTIMIEFVRDDEVDDPPPVDPYTTLLVHFDDYISDDLDMIGDEFSISTSNYKLGAGSGYFNGERNCAVSKYSASFLRPEHEDYTIDFWIKSNESVLYADILSFGRSGALPNIAYNQYGNLCFRPRGSTSDELQCTQNINDSNWHHLAYVLTGSTTMLFVDGVLHASREVDRSLFDDAWATYAIIGPMTNTQYPVFVGFLDEFRISHGVARWTSDFTPPTAPY